MAGVNNARVCGIISDKLHYSGGSSISGHLSSAFDLISDDREGDYKTDIDYAAAEHYLFARWLVCSCPYLYVSVYMGNAIYENLIPDFLKKTFGKGPTSPTSFEMEAWGRRGCQDGLKESTDWLNTVPEIPTFCATYYK